MTINDIARMMASRERYQHRGLEQFANHSNTPPAGHKYYEDGMDITGIWKDCRSFSTVSDTA